MYSSTVLPLQRVCCCNHEKHILVSAAINLNVYREKHFETSADIFFMVPSIVCRPVVAYIVVKSDVTAEDFNCLCHESAVLLP